MVKHKLSISPDYVSHWGIQEAIREVCANWLDSSGSNVYDINEDSGFLELTNKDTTIPLKSLILGNSEHRKDSKSTGCFGEGLKVALLVLCREGVDVVIKNGAKVWKPVFEYDEHFQSEILVIEEDEGEGEDYSVILSDLDCRDIEEVVERCLYLRDIGETRDCENGRVLLGESGKLYVGGIYVCDLDGGHKYSYDFNPQYLPLNRDRTYAQHWDIKTGIARLLLKAFPTEEISEMVEANSTDTSYMEYCIGESLFTKVAEVLYDRLEEEHGDDFVITDDYDDYKKYEERGLNAILVNNTMARMVSGYTKYNHEERTKEEEPEEKDDRSPLEMLQEMFDDFLYDLLTQEQADEFTTLMNVFEERGVSWDD